MRAAGLAGLFAGLAAAGPLVAAGCNPIAQSHIDGNVPARDQFEALLERDLQRYFSAQAGGDVTVAYELLRKAPTQSGAAAPKYYAWVIVNAGNGPKLSGAVRLAAVQKVEFAVTHFVSAEDIKANPESAVSVFPQALLPRIRELAAQP